eukprot:2957027-Amphidinium_carterae.1
MTFHSRSAPTQHVLQSLHGRHISSPANLKTSLPAIESNGRHVTVMVFMLSVQSDRVLTKQASLIHLICHQNTAATRFRTLGMTHPRRSFASCCS